MTTTEVTADQAIEGLRLYLQQFSLALPGDDLTTTAGVFQRVVFYLDRFRQLEAQSRGQFGHATCGGIYGLTTPHTGFGVATPVFGLGTPNTGS